MQKYAMALLQRPDASRCVLFNQTAETISMAETALKPESPKADFLEQDAEKMFSALVEVAKEALGQASLDHRNVISIGIANEREGAVVWDKKTGKPIYPYICADDRRAVAGVSAMDGLEAHVRKVCGLPISARFSALKLKWILDNVEGARSRAQNGELLFGTLDSWLIWNLSGGKAHVTDTSNASRTMLFNIAESKWDEQILAALAIPACMMPTAYLSSHIYTETEPSVLGGAIPVSGAAGIQHASFFAETYYDLGRPIGILDDTCNILLHTGTTPIFCDNGLMTSVSYGISGRSKFALEGEPFALGTPEETAARVCEIMRLMREATDAPFSPIRISGRMSRDDRLLQAISNCLQENVERSACTEIPALGAAYLGGLPLGYWEGRCDILPNWKADRVFTPDANSNP